MQDRYTVPEIYNEANKLLFLYELNGWTFGINNRKKSFGVCKYATKQIEIARWWIEHGTREQVKDTLLHELAHALVGPGHGHGLVWKFAAQKLGAIPRAGSKIKPQLNDHKYEVICRSCGSIVKRMYRRPNTVKYNRTWHKPCGRGSMGLVIKEVK